MKYYIEIPGCHETTRLVVFLTDGQFALVQSLANCISKASTYGCMPTLNVKPVSECEDWELRETREFGPITVD